jgi:hypothetical protein
MSRKPRAKVDVHAAVDRLRGGPPHAQVAVGLLRPHPRNYKKHPPDQVHHLRASLREYGFYRNVVVARDYTILAGHGIVEAALAEGYVTVPVVRLDLDSDAVPALKILASDNTIPTFGDQNEYELARLLESIAKVDPSALLGTGYDERSLALLLSQFAPPEPTAPAPAPGDEWQGMPDFDQVDRLAPHRVTVHFANDADADEFFRLIGRPRRTSMWWPKADGHVGSSLKQKYVAQGGKK